VQSDGKIIVVGLTGTSSSSFDQRFLRSPLQTPTVRSTPPSAAALGYAVIKRLRLDGERYCLPGRYPKRRQDLARRPSPTAISALVRLNADGTLDTLFGGTGKVTTSIGTTDGAFAMALQSDGKIVLGGFSGTSSSVYDFALARYNADGSLDTTFNGTGKRTYSVGPNGEHIYGLLVQSDGKFVVAGGAVLSATDGGDFALARFNADASLDTSFATAGISTAQLRPRFRHLSCGTAAGRRQRSGRRLLGGRLHDVAHKRRFKRAAVWRLLADGTLDTSFGTNGYFVSTNSSLIDVSTLLVQSDGKIIVVANVGTRIARLSQPALSIRPSALPVT